MKKLLAASLVLLSSLAQAAPINVYSISGPGGLIDPSILIQYLAQYQQYNPAAVAITGGSIQIDSGTTASPSLAFASATNSGLIYDNSQPTFVNAGNRVAAIGTSSNGLVIRTDSPLSWGTTGSATTSPDLFLFRDAAADTLAQRRTTNAQTFRLYNTFTDASNYERLGMTWSGNVMTLAAQAAGTGAQRRIDIVGTPTNDSAAAGSIGEIITASLAVGSATSLVTATAKDVTTVSLTSGDWDCAGVIDFKPAATTNATLLLFGSSSSANTLGADDTFGSVVFLTAGQVTTNGDYRNVIPTQRFSLAGPGANTVRLVAQATFTVSTMTAYGSIRCRRVR